MKKLITLATILLAFNASAETFYQNDAHNITVDSFDTQYGTACRMVIGNGFEGDASLIWALAPSGHGVLTSSVNGEQGKRFIFRYNHDEAKQNIKGFQKGMFEWYGKDLEKLVAAEDMQIVVQDGRGENHVNDVNLSNIVPAIQAYYECGQTNHIKGM